eukprot:CAMPEP_0185021878 /NCGR_PEP_ID=MMETSP1103-20130426/4580_1 /TAXON_ID=36769 /ORGANISM="Paraphysomonas bandaiensis, Strain Caron Lab Isolate" /LENGTH=518 /DNA_ID=CAMNT_0027553657 /DNA_START=161 /DNA_END=1717 /DNA_ORIENTATION=-
MIVHSGVVFAGVLTYEALKVSDCISDDDSDESCSADKDDDSNDNSDDCRRLWGLIKPDSLLTVLATTAAVVLALSSMFMGTIADATPYRRQFGIIGTSMCVVGMALCTSILQPNEVTIAICGAGLVIHYIFKDYHYIVIESYTPELSHIPEEVSTILSVTSVWFYVFEVLTIVVWVIVGSFIAGSLFGFVVTVVSVVVVGCLIPVAYSRLPDVATPRPFPPGTSIVSYTLSRQVEIFSEICTKYPDFGIVLLANMIYDPALSALFVAAIQVLVSKYHFTASDIPIILGVAIISAIVGAYFARCVSYAPDSSCPPSSLLVRQSSFHLDAKSGNDTAVKLSSEAKLVQSVSKHPKRLKWSIVIGLIVVTGITICGTFFLVPCALGLACWFGAMWGMSLAFCWTCSSILRSALVPGGSEAEYAGILYTTTNAVNWLPLLIFSIANEVWTIEGAMLTLVLFYLAGGLVLAAADTDRALNATVGSLELRRWANKESAYWLNNIVKENTTCDTQLNDHVVDIEL